MTYDLFADNQPKELTSNEVELHHFLSDKTKKKILECAASINISPDTLIDRLLDAEIERLRLFNFSKEAPIDGKDSKIEQVPLIKVCREFLSTLNGNSETEDIKERIEALYYKLLEDSLISTQTVRGSIVESKRMKLPKTAYYWYGGDLSKKISLWFGCLNIYLYHELYATEHEVIFVGMPANVVVSQEVFLVLLQIFKTTKREYKNLLGCGSNAEKENEANQYIYERTNELDSVEAYIESQGESYPEEDKYLLYDYQEEQYGYTAR